MTFQLRPQIYSLLLCASARQNEDSGGWLLEPFSHVTVRSLPVDLAMTVVAHLMAPPGSYDFALRLFPAARPDAILTIPPRHITVEEGKNLEFLLHVELTLEQPGLYVVEASLPDHHTLQAPLRVSLT